MSEKVPKREIRRLLIANRGEIATRIISAARECTPPLETFAICTESDDGHTIGATHKITLSAASAYLDIDALLKIVQENSIDAVHPGYGFLSESSVFARRLWSEAGAIVIGPGAEILERTGDKLAARRLAEECKVPVLPATTEPTNSVDKVRTFASHAGWPLMLKAVDGGGGKGIRIVRHESDLENSVKRAVAESPSQQIFVERAAIDGFRHVEVQIIGDGSGSVISLDERECSIQRRYQKIVELAPSTIEDDNFRARIIESALSMAKHLQYLSLGTFEFLANPRTQEFFFLEVNPRLQVEHTVTECVHGVDIVQTQLAIAQGASLSSLNIPQRPASHGKPPLYSIQLRLTAENVQSDWSLSIGKITHFRFPSGSGMRVDTHLVPGRDTVVSADFDSLLAKIIVTGRSFNDAVGKARRALEDTIIVGVKTNLDALRAIVASEDFAKAQCDTTWLEQHQNELLQEGQRISAAIHKSTSVPSGGNQDTQPLTGMSTSTVLLRKGDAWSIRLSPAENDGSKSSTEQAPMTHHLKLSKVLRNEFPSSLSALLEYTTENVSAPMSLQIDASATNASSSATTSAGRHPQGDLSNPRHICIPFAGTLVEVMVDEGDQISAGQVVAIVRQMKMELEVKARTGGKVKWVTEAQDGEEVPEGLLAAELEEGDHSSAESERAKL